MVCPPVTTVLKRADLIVTVSFYSYFHLLVWLPVGGVLNCMNLAGHRIPLKKHAALVRYCRETKGAHVVGSAGDVHHKEGTMSERL